jgi:hypothetical protein
MRLSTVERRHGLKQRLILGLIRLTTRMEPHDVVKTLMYRPGFFGQRYGELVQAVMRGPSEWAVGERELFAAFTSRINECRY